MVEETAKPLVTFFVIAYNHSRFIREAVEGALAQTYQSIEIVLSDDCSTDDTFEIMEEMVRSYAGPHTIVLNRNERNLGLSEHLNRIVELSSGELIIAADGDDVSIPQRTERCVEVWLEHGRPAALASSVSCIDAQGNASTTKNGLQWFSQFFPREREARIDSLLRFSREGSPRLVSCSAAWTRRVCEEFGPLAPGIWFEDDVITLRAWLYDRIAFIPEALVRYREHDSNLFNRARGSLATPAARRRAEQATMIDAQRRRHCLLSYTRDLERAMRQHWITPPQLQTLTADVARRCRFHRAIEKWWTVSWIGRIRLFFLLVRSGRARHVRWAVPRLLPFRTFVFLGALRSRRRERIEGIPFGRDSVPTPGRPPRWQRARQWFAIARAGRAEAANHQSGSSWRV